MKPVAGLKKNLLRLYLDPGLFTREEAEENLQEWGIDTEQLRVKGEKFIKKLEAKRALNNAGQKREEFLKLVEQFKKEDTEPKNTSDSCIYKMAARGQNGSGIHEPGSEIDDVKLMEYLKMKGGGSR